jgi:signal transduction histidine kinase
MSDTLQQPSRVLLNPNSGADQLQRLHQVTESLAGASTPQEVALAVVSAALPALSASTGHLFVVSADGAYLESAASVNAPPEHESRWQRIPMGMKLPVTVAFQSGEPVLLGSRQDAAQDYPEIADYQKAIGGEAIFAILLRIGERKLGSLVCMWKEAREFGTGEKLFISALAGICAQALERARLVESERRARHRAERLQALTAALSAAITTEEVSRASLNEGMRALGAGAGGVVLITPDGEHQDLVSLGGMSEEAIGKKSWWRFSLKDPYPVNEVVHTGAPIFMVDIDEFQARFPAVAPTVREAGYQAYCAAPLQVEGRMLGAINYNFLERRTFDDDDVALLRAMAQQCAQALERARLYDAEQSARAEAEAARSAAESANQVKSQFLATMSHELRTPLNAISGYAELLELGIHGPLTEEQRGALRRIQRSQKHLLSLINEVLSYARIEAGAVRYDFTEVGLAGALAGVESIMLPQVRARKIQLSVATVDPSLMVRADSEKLSQVLLNLLANAVKFTPQGGSISIAVRELEDTVDVAVIDSGVGIPEDQLDRIFEPFVQVGRKLSSAGEGTGLGLAISRDFARGMGGDLTVSSKVGEGSTFTLTLTLPVTGNR